MKNKVTLIRNVGASVKNASNAAEISNRPFGAVKGIVTANDDPDGKRRIKATIAAMPGIDTPWLERLKIIPGLDANIPEIGSTVLILFEENDFLNGLWIPIENTVSPPQTKNNRLLDWWLNVPGIIQIFASDNSVDIEMKDGKITINANVIINGNVSIVGDVDIEGDISIEGDLFLTSDTIEILNANSVSINNKQISTVGAVDQAGHALVNRGW